MRCAHCGSTNTQAGLHEYTCLGCGLQTHADGTALAPDPQFTVRTAADGPEPNPFVRR